MEKWADYVISHVKKNSSGNITHVLLHTDNGDTITSGTIKSEAEVIVLLKQGYTIITVVWGYPKWNKGATVEYVKGHNGEFLRTNRDKTEKDNLENMIKIYN